MTKHESTEKKVFNPQACPFFQDGRKIKGSDFPALEEISLISSLCNDSSIDFNDFKNIYERIGEPTEAALIVLAEKINPYDVPKRGTKHDIATAVRK